MLARENSRNNVCLYNLRSHEGSTMSKLTQKLHKTVAANLTRNLRNRNRIADSREEHSNFKLSDFLDKEIITEIQYRQHTLPDREVVTSITDRKLDRSMEIVDSIVTSNDKVVKTVKFEEEVHREIVAKSHKNYLGKSAIKSCRNSKIKVNRALKGSNSRKRVVSARSGKLYSAFSSRKVAKQGEDYPSLSKQDSRTTDYSRPSSVTSLFTACSTGFPALSQKFGLNSEMMNRHKSDSKPVDPLKNREVVQCIAESLYLPNGHQGRSERPSKKNLSKLKAVHAKKMSLIVETQSELEKSADMSVDSPPPAPTQKQRKIVSVKVTTPKQVKCEPVYFTSITLDKTPTACSEASFSNFETPKRGFKCFKESDVLKYKNCEPVELIYNLVKGDEDEESDEEDLQHCQNYLQQELHKSLKALIKQNKKDGK